VPAATCPYGLFTTAPGSQCGYANFLFDMTNDEYEATNLWDSEVTFL